MPRRAVPRQVFQRPAARRVHSGTRTSRNLNYRHSVVYTATLTNLGPVDTYPTATIAGPITAATVYFENATSVKTVAVATSVPNGQTLTVNFQARTVTLNGVDITSQVTIDSRWWALAPGANLVRSNVAATVTFRSTTT